MSSRPTDAELQLATKLAWRIGSRWKNVEEEDLASHLTLWLFQNVHHLERWRLADTGRGRLYVALKREASKYCARETTARIGQPLNAGRFYNIDRIRRVMPFIFEDTPLDAIAVNPTTGQPIGTGGTGEAATILMDVRSAYYDLAPPTRELLGLRYRDGLSHEEIAELRGLTVEASKTAIHRALKRMSDNLGE
jgi:DNA-directed RNA polymerase specialized sigma24 family protein